nr:MAG TPA: hypothetical protein [Caudoviricetes sp.]
MFVLKFFNAYEVFKILNYLIIIVYDNLNVFP